LALHYINGLPIGVKRESRMMTDKAHHYTQVGKEFAEHGRVDHGQFEWKRGDWHTNTFGFVMDALH
jgi:hypothetical protein